MSNNTVNFTINLNGTAYTGIAQLDKALGKLNITSKKTESLFDRITNGTFAFNNIFQTAQTLVGRVSGSIEKMIDAGSSNELQKMNMVTLFRGNTAAAEEMFNKISQYGKETVYDKAGLLDAQRTMMSFGISGEKSFETLKQIGDIAMGDKQKMQSLALAFSQATSLGKLEGTDYKQLINAGFNPLQVISERTGESIASLEDKMRAGQISAKMLSQAFRWATDEQGLFYKGAEKAGATTAGKINLLKESIEEFLIKIFYKLKPFIDATLTFATGFLEGLPALLSSVGRAVKNVIGFFVDFSPILIGVTAAVLALTLAIKSQDLILNILIIKEKAVVAVTKAWVAIKKLLNMVMTANPIALIIAGVAILIGVIVYLCSKITGWGSLWKGVVGFMKYSFFAFLDAIKFRFTSHINGFLLGLDAIKLGWYKFKEAAGLGDSSENQAAIAKISTDIETRKKAIADGAKSIADNAKKAKESLGGIEMGWDSSKKSKNIFGGIKAKLGINEQLQAAASGAGGNDAGNTGSATSEATEAVATGGTKSTNVTINLKNLVEKIVFEGTTAENRSEIERNLAEAMFRVLNMAQSSIG